MYLMCIINTTVFILPGNNSLCTLHTGMTLACEIILNIHHLTIHYFKSDIILTDCVCTPRQIP